MKKKGFGKVLETKNLSDMLMQHLNDLYLKGYSFEEVVSMGIGNDKIRVIVEMAFHEGYADCLKDVREGLIK
jgi:hypothetical protein